MMIRILFATAITFILTQDIGTAGGNHKTNEQREYYNYELKQHGKVVYRGQTLDLSRREKEHRRDGKKFTHLNKVGNAKTYEGVRKAEARFLETYRKTHNGNNPKYNKTNHG